MKTTQILSLIRETIVAYGGWSAGGYLASKLTNNESSIWQGRFWGMVISTMFSGIVDKKLEKDAITPSKEKDPPKTEVIHRTDHAERIKTKQDIHSHSMKL